MDCIICLEECKNTRFKNKCNCIMTIHMDCYNKCKNIGLLCPICRNKKLLNTDTIELIDYPFLLFTNNPNLLTFILYFIFSLIVTIFLGIYLCFYICKILIKNIYIKVFNYVN